MVWRWLHKHFFKNAERIKSVEASLLAAVLPNPRKFKVDAPSPYVYECAVWFVISKRNQASPQNKLLIDEV